MLLLIDHLIVAARTLEEGAAWLEARLGVPTSPGGKHAAMGTHTRLLSLGAGRYVEIIAVDPEAPPPGRPRWFGLDTPEMAARLARGPALVHWVARTDDMDQAVAATAAGQSDVLALSRGRFHWRIAVSRSGHLAQDGIAPTIIEWVAGGHPSEFLPDVGCRLEALVLHHPEAAAALRTLSSTGLDAGEPIRSDAQGRGISAQIRTPHGIVEVRE